MAILATVLCRRTYSAVASILTRKGKAVVTIGFHLTVGALKAFWTHAGEAIRKALHVVCIELDFFFYSAWMHQEHSCVYCSYN